MNPHGVLKKTSLNFDALMQWLFVQQNSTVNFPVIFRKVLKEAQTSEYAKTLHVLNGTKQADFTFRDINSPDSVK